MNKAEIDPRSLSSNIIVEVEELIFIFRNLGNIYSKRLWPFCETITGKGRLRKSAVLERIPRLATMIDHSDLLNVKLRLSKRIQEMQKNFKDLEESLYVLGQDPDLIAYEDAERNKQHKELESQDLLKFKEL